MKKTLNTYISISIMSYQNSPEYNSGHIHTHNKAAKLDLHLDIPYKQAKRELAKLMLRTGELPDVVGKDDGTDSTMYILTAFLD
jgi:hypothetical protein